MKKIRRQVVSTLGCSYPVLLILLLVGLFAALAPHSFHNVSVTHAQSETEAPLPGGGGDAGGPAAPVVTGTAYSAPDFVRFTWERVEGAEEYEVLWRRGAGGTWAHVAQSPLASTGYDFYQESAGTTLSLLVRAIAADGKVSAWSNLAQATVPGTATQTPTATVSTQSAPRLSARHAGADAIDLNWTSVSGADRYVLYRQKVDNLGWQQIDDGNLRGTSFTDGGLTPGVTYQYALRAIDANGQPLGPWSNYPTATVSESGASTSTPTSTPTFGPTQTPTATVSTLTAPRLSARNAGADAIDLSWTSVSGAVRYELHRQEVAAPGWQQIDDGNLRGTSFTDGGLTPGVTYQYALRAIDANGQPLGPWSNFPTETVLGSDASTLTSTPTPTVTTPTVTSTPTPGPTQTSTPTATVSTQSAPRLSARNAGANAIDLSWTSVSGAVRYELLTWWASDPGWQNIDDSLQGTSYRHSGLTPGRTYFYALRSVDANGVAGEWTHSPYPTATVPESGASTSTPTPTVTSTPTPTVTSTPTPGPTQTSTPTATVSTQSTPRLSARHAGANAIDLSWTSVSGAVRYELLTWWASDPGWQNIDDNLQGTSYRHSGLTPGRTYFYALRSVDANGVAGEWTHSPYPTATVPESGASTSTPTPTVTSTPTPGPTQTSTPTATVSTQSTPRLSARHAGANAIDLSWTSVSGAVRYVLFRQEVADPGWQQIDGGNLQGTTYTDGGLTPGVTYQYAVGAIDANGQLLGPWSNFPTATVPESDASTLTPTPTVTASAATTAAQRAALVALYKATDGANWTNNDNWLSAAPLSAWYGVTTDTSGHVTRLFLSNNRLNGQLPDLSALTNLTGLYLNDNQLSGSIPDLSTFSKLTELYLYSNQLVGQIPDLRSNATLEVLHLAFNQLTGSIPDLSALTNLTGLYLYSNRLTGHIPDLSHLTNLTALYLNNNLLTGHIPDLSRLTNLTALYLNNNLLTGLFPDLRALTKLTDLSLIGNQLCVPEDADLSGSNTVVATHLQSLILPSCSDDPPVVQSTSTATATTSTLATATPTATATTSTLATATSTATATPTATAIPPVPAEERAALVALYNATDGPNWTINDNWLTDAPISTWYGVFTDESGHVSRLTLDRNGLRGTIPDLGALTKLTNLEITRNSQLSGKIPDLSALTNLTNLDLGGNRLSGSIPNIRSLTNLKYLNLNYNELSGPIPNMAPLKSLIILNLSNNELSGPIPDLSTLTNLNYLYLSNNQLSGPIPNLSALTNLTRLILSDNQLTGPVQNMGTSTKLTILQINDNQLTGAVPDLSNYTNLWFLNLSNNRLQGSIPSLNDLTNLRELSLGGNQLTGSIPSLNDLTKLLDLTLESNQLSGPIPDLSALTNLRNLSLGGNRLDGPILDLSVLTNLTTLNLINNQLSGPIPDLGALAKLENLQLSGNQFCLRPGLDLSDARDVVSAHLNDLNLATCTETELAAVPGVVQNFMATVGNNQVTLTWDRVTNAASYDLWEWDSFDRNWRPIGGTLTVNSYTYTVLKDGRNYYYQVRARDANGLRGAWSERVYAVVVPQQFPPPPVSLGLDIFFQKYLIVEGITVVAPSEVPDEQMVQARDIITGMLSNRRDLLGILAVNSTRIAIHGSGGSAANLPTGWVARMAQSDPHCGVFIHEMAHLIHFAIEEQPGGEAFNSRLRTAYQAALNAGLYQGWYASTNTVEYWAETARFWFQGTLPRLRDGSLSTLADYDPEAAKLIEEVFGDAATVPASCKP